MDTSLQIANNCVGLYDLSSLKQILPPLALTFNENRDHKGLNKDQQTEQPTINQTTLVSSLDCINLNLNTSFF